MTEEGSRGEIRKIQERLRKDKWGERRGETRKEEERVERGEARGGSGVVWSGRVKGVCVRLPGVWGEGQPTAGRQQSLVILSRPQANAPSCRCSVEHVCNYIYSIYIYEVCVINHYNIIYCVEDERQTDRTHYVLGNC